MEGWWRMLDSTRASRDGFLIGRTRGRFVLPSSVPSSLVQPTTNPQPFTGCLHLRGQIQNRRCGLFPMFFPWWWLPSLRSHAQCATTPAGTSPAPSERATDLCQSVATSYIRAASSLPNCFFIFQTTQHKHSRLVNQSSPFLDLLNCRYSSPSSSREVFYSLSFHSSITCLRLDYKITLSHAQLERTKMKLTSAILVASAALTSAQITLYVTTYYSPRSAMF